MNLKLCHTKWQAEAENFRHTDTQKNNVRQPMAVADKGDTGMAKGSAARMI